MTNELPAPEQYERWLAERREVGPSSSLADQIMTQVAELERQSQDNRWLRLAQQIERSRSTRWSVCAGALAIGCLPFLFLAYVPSI